MGYLIKKIGTLEKISVTVPQSSIATLDTIPVQIIDSNILTNYTIVAANLTMLNATGNVTNFGHFYLQFSYVITLLEKLAVFDENVGNISTDKQSNFLINASHPPNRFGSVSSFTQDLTLISELPPTPTNDLIVTVYYFNNF